MPADIKHGALNGKMGSSSSALLARQKERQFLRQKNAMISSANKNQSSHGMDSSKSSLRPVTNELLMKHDMAMKQANRLRRQCKKLHLDSKKRDTTDYKEVVEKAESTRATYLLRQAQNKNCVGSLAEKTGSYGHMIKRTDERIQGISALAQSLSVKF